MLNKNLEEIKTNQSIMNNAKTEIKRQASQSYAKHTDTPRITTGHFIALQKEEIQLHPPEERNKLPQPGNLDKPPIQPHP